MFTWFNKHTNIESFRLMPQFIYTIRVINNYENNSQNFITKWIIEAKKKKEKKNNATKFPPSIHYTENRGI